MHGWGPPPGPRGPRNRMFEKGELKYLFLDLLREKPRHGYDLIRAVEELSGGRYTASPGAVYPILQMMEDLGHVTVSTADGRKTYTVTPAGEAFLEENKATVEQLRQRITSAWGGDGREEWHTMLHELAQFAQFFGRGRPMHHRGMDPETVRRISEVVRKARAEIEAILEEARD